ncbi:MAG: hypothetical protein UV74_C0013G0272 [Candidatus Woesebacteria bacterium GW2011_GWB1_43_14]|uniref:Uncharacterized protein n=1 Tax=Candidatus Woesebacteria bacterium GW2011_GWB1_43_14 TaxID=1618578 RepID=A0A0G1DH25_9BACT|nr:MAG: hypothetical protein UT21_C0002G0020 [Candidatus Woesebacteria bacterium GW2011_GWA1_39_11b]KKS78433.1 MAG: hypothetical protein UV51_C0001G0149 [Candidatus Woesebacteria bacterium GW2011_GWC1_42_9]KKS97150.1 MAG: hypothetical protein UV74_C0013G0272 [Candidatus Woesebacteria bacterium GW2011_GWB1_43_14]
MKEVGRYVPEILDFKNLPKHIKRYWRTTISPPPESKIFLPPERVVETGEKLDGIETRPQPKQVVYDPSKRNAYVSCMSGRSLQKFSHDNRKLHFADEVNFEDQCVEVAIDGGLLYATTTNFERPPRKTRNQLWIINAENLSILSSLNTGGNWSKLIAVNPIHNEIMISNWHSHNISVIDTSDSFAPKLKQTLEWGEAPRGIAFAPDGNSAIVTGFYSGNLGVFKKYSDEWFNITTTEPFEKPRYSGNMRHIIIDERGEYAYVSNLGRNLLLQYSTDTLKNTKKIAVGKSPNSIDFLGNNEIIVSCRGSSCVYLVDIDKEKVQGRSQYTGKEPTGLCRVSNSSFLVTCFGDNTLEFHQIH